MDRKELAISLVGSRNIYKCKIKAMLIKQIFRPAASNTYKNTT